jgi:hypothetical protein
MENAQVVKEQPAGGQTPLPPVGKYQAVATVLPDPGHIVTDDVQTIVPWLSQNRNS